MLPARGIFRKQISKPFPQVVSSLCLYVISPSFFQAKTTEDIYKSYSIPMRPVEKQQQQQNTFSYQGFNRPMMSHSHYPMYPTASGSYHPSGVLILMII